MLFLYENETMKTRLVQLSLLAIVCLLLSSCAGLRYSDQGKPLDFLHAKRYKAAKKELVKEQAEKSEQTTSPDEKVLDKEVESTKKSIQGDLPLWLFIVLAIILPPLSVGLYEGVTGRFWLNLVLFVIGYGLVGILGNLALIASILAIIHALLIVLDVI